MYKNITNIHYLYILYNILKLFENRNYIYLGTNYEKIKIDKEKVDNNINNNETKISDYNYIIKNKKHNLIFKINNNNVDKNNNYILVLFLESFGDIENNIDFNYIFKRISDYILDHDYYQNMEKVYIICPDDHEDKIKKKIHKEGFDILEIMKYSNLLYNPTQHTYFNKHEKIKNYEQKHKKYDLKLPIILKTDVACKWYDYKINDIIKITRKDNSICYRIVKDDDINN